MIIQGSRLLHLVAMTFFKALKSSAGYFCIQQREKRDSKSMDDPVGISFSGHRLEVTHITSTHIPVSITQSHAYP